MTPRRAPSRLLVGHSQRKAEETEAAEAPEAETPVTEKKKKKKAKTEDGDEAPATGESVRKRT